MVEHCEIRESAFDCLQIKTNKHFYQLFTLIPKCNKMSKFQQKNYPLESIPGARWICESLDYNWFLRNRQCNQINTLHFNWKRIPLALAQFLVKSIKLAGNPLAKFTIDKKPKKLLKHIHDCARESRWIWSVRLYEK